MADHMLGPSTPIDQLSIIHAIFSDLSAPIKLAPIGVERDLTLIQTIIGV
jgi:hypothetical protein